MVWLSMFRIVSPRMSRRRHMFTFLIYVSLEPVAVIQELIAFSAIMEPALDGGVLHITNDKTKPVSDIIHYAQTYFHITGIRAVEADDYPAGRQNNLAPAKGSQGPHEIHRS